MTHRRAFLKQLGLIAGAPGLGKLMGLDRAFAEELGRLPRPDAGDASLSDLRDSYLLSPDIILAGERKPHSIELVANSY